MTGPQTIARTVRDGAVRHADPRVAEPAPTSARVHVALDEATGLRLLTAPVNLGEEETTRGRRPAGRIPRGWQLVGLRPADGPVAWHLEMPAGRADAVEAFLAEIEGVA